MEPSERHRWTNFVTSCTLDQSADHLCHQFLNLNHLLPTAAAAKFHSYHAYLAVQQWVGNNLCPTDWGWDEILVPLTTDRPIAPTRVLRIVSCCCKTGCRKTCGCRKAGLYCSPTCSHSNGQTCSNTHALAVSQDSDDDP